MIYGEKGQTLIEVIVGIFIISIVLITLISAVNYSVRNAHYAKNKSLATKYVEEGLEAVRSIKEHDWNAIISASYRATNGIYFNSTSNQWVFDYQTGYDYPVNGSTEFKRTVAITRNSPPSGSTTTSVQVYIKVCWNYQSLCDAFSDATVIYTRF